jgi:LmbE family N-acetylglucosaminyl deacetylase
VAQVHLLGFADSGLDGEVAGGFAQQPVQVVAGSIATICDHVGADVLIGYDPRGGYGHPDHVQIHRSTRAAAGTCVRRPRLFEATLPREPIAGAVRLAARLRLTPDDFDPAAFDRSWTPRAQITHRVDVRRYIAAKDASLRAHGSQATSNSTMRTLGVLTRLPGPVQSILLGTEYYVAVPSPPAIPATVSTSPESS